MHLARTTPWLLVALAGLSAFAAPPVHAQAFGKNKVHYEALEWAVLETPHLRLHYYAEEESLARSLAAFAESVAVEFDGPDRWLDGPEVRSMERVNGAMHLLLAEGADHQAILRRGVEAGATIYRFDLVEPRLHEIFVRHAGDAATGDAGTPTGALGNMGGRR